MAEAIFGAVLLAVFAYIAWKERLATKEREAERAERAALMERIKTPSEEIAALPPLDDAPPPDLFDESVEPSPGLLLDRLMED